MEDGFKTAARHLGDSKPQLQDDSYVPELDVFEFDRLDIVMLNKFAKNLCYTVDNMYKELVSENKIKDTKRDTIRKRLDRKFVPKKLVFKIRTFGVVYDFNEKARAPVQDLTRKFLATLGANQLL